MYSSILNFYIFILLFSYIIIYIMNIQNPYNNVGIYRTLLIFSECHFRMIQTKSIVPNNIRKISECSKSPNPGLGGGCDQPLLKASFDFRRTAPWERAHGAANVRSEGHAV